MNINKKKSAVLLATALCALSTAFAQDWDSFEDDSSFGFGDDFDSFSSFDSSSSGSAVTVSGSASTAFRAYIDPWQQEPSADDPSELTLSPFVGAKLGAAYSGNNVDADLTLTFDANIIKNYPADVIDELTIRGYFGNLIVEAGKMKVVWGKGDKLHVLDNFNADDYTDFIIPDYVDRRISTPMLRALYSIPVGNLTFEGIFTPLTPVDRFASEGVWVPAQVKNLTAIVTAAAKNNLALTLDNFKEGKVSGLDVANAVVSLSDFTTDDLYLANLNSLKYSQAGLRSTFSIGSIDVGTSYYYGHYKQPSANLSKYIASIERGIEPALMKYAQTESGKAYIQQKYGAEIQAVATELGASLIGQTINGTTVDATNVKEVNTQVATKQVLAKHAQEMYDAGLLASSWTTPYDYPTLAYDTKQTFSIEAATIIWHFNVRGEFAYNMTEDFAGDDPWVHNHSIAWLGGFDIDLPFWNANLNVQETGTLVLNNKKIEDGTYKTYDVDYNPNGYTNDKIVVNFSTSFMNDKLAPEITFLWGIENGDIVVQPKIAYKPFDTLTLTASGMYIWCRDDDSEFAGWNRNSFVSLGASIQF